MSENTKIGIVGLGYVGLPLARLFATKYLTLGFDIDQKRIKELNRGIDKTLEIDEIALSKVLLISDYIHKKRGLYCSANLKDLHCCNFYIITVPTPVDEKNLPELTPLIRASEMIGSILKKGDIVVYESTVYPGATEEDCVPILERCSKLKFNIDFFVGYSPERINPGDKTYTVDKILKITSGSTREIGEKIDKIYKSVIVAGTYLAPTIKVAEAAKVVENSQRDVNIAFVNELSKIFNLMDIDTHEVLKAAETKWNFLPFKPGLVGGHCISVDSYYLTEKSKALGYNPRIISAARKINNGMADYIALAIKKLMRQKKIKMEHTSVLILGITFKENCSDIRNTKVVDLVKKLQDYKMKVTVYDPIANANEVFDEYDLKITTTCPKEKYQLIVLAVPHQELLRLNLSDFSTKNTLIYDVKSVLRDIPVHGKL